MKRFQILEFFRCQTRHLRLCFYVLDSLESFNRKQFASKNGQQTKIKDLCCDLCDLDSPDSGVVLRNTYGCENCLDLIRPCNKLHCVLQQLNVSQGDDRCLGDRSSLINCLKGHLIIKFWLVHFPVVLELRSFWWIIVKGNCMLNKTELEESQDKVKWSIWIKQHCYATLRTFPSRWTHFHVDFELWIEIPYEPSS